MEPLKASDDYRSYVEHPRYGRGPRLTGIDPTLAAHIEGADMAHWHSGPEVRIPNTAIAANMSKQSHAAGTGSYGSPIAYYFDVRRVCRDCNQKFIFFAEEQKYWYEELRFPLEVDCVRCHACRRMHRSLDRLRERYNELVLLQEPGPTELLELASLSIDLIGGGTFSAHPRTFSRVRMWLNRLSKFPDHDSSRTKVTQRLTELEAAQREEIRRIMEQLQERDPLA